MATLSQVAKLAGVSIATASKVLNKSAAAAEISARTQEAVLRAAREVNYTPHPIAHSLRTSRTHTIGFISPYMPDVHLSPILRSVQELLDKHGYGFLISVTERSVEREMQWMEFFRHRVDGLIIAVEPGVQGSDDVAPKLQAEKISAVLLGMESSTPGIPSAVVNTRDGARRGVEHLIDLGHRKIAYLGGRADSFEERARYTGYRLALEAAEIPLDQELVMEDTSLADYGYSNAKKLLSSRAAPTALFTFNDSMAMGAIHACADLGKRIPEDISLVGFDDLTWAAHISPPLTTVRQPRAELGVSAATLLLELIARKSVNGKSKEGKSGQNIVLGMDLVVRKSTAPPRR